MALSRVKCTASAPLDKTDKNNDWKRKINYVPFLSFPSKDKSK